MIDFSKPCESFEQACAEFVDVTTGNVKMARGTVTQNSPSFFTGVVPLHGRWGDWFFAKNDLLFVADTEGRLDLLKPIISGAESVDISLTRRAAGAGMRLGGVGFVRVRTRRMSPALRGKLVLSPPSGSVLIEISDGMLNSKGWSCASDFMCFAAGRWRLLAKAIDRRCRQVDDNAIAALVGAASVKFTLRYEWRVNIGPESGGSMNVVVGRESVPEIFRLRDVPEGKSRRSALLHFVSQHWKRSRGQAPTEDPAVFVREHLRGQTKFSWNGLRCEVMPPRYDVERLPQAQDRA